jgi:serine/threonine protein phosphatase PrpC
MNVHSVSIKGLRPQNEDKHEIFLNANNKFVNLKNINLFAIFDGHGGKDVSKYIKDNLPKYFTNKKTQYPLQKNFVIDTYDKLQRELKGYKFAHRAGSTSLVVIYFKYNGGNYLNVINSGDCRAIICHDNFAIPLTKDHKPFTAEERYRIEQLGGTIKWDGHDWRVQDLSVSRSFGDTDTAPYVTHRPDLFRYKLNKNDKFIVLGCDGLWDVMSNDEVVNFILINCYDKAVQKRLNTNINIAKKLAEHALKKGSTDNISIIVVFFK